MSLNYQGSTLSLTLPISCQICLGKVRQPVICANHHVFCSSCMKMWLKKASQCPTCREPITAENPCREIIGGTNEGDYSESPSMRKCLRKTRGELLLREYEEEIDGLVRENEELKLKNQSLEERLKTALLPCNLNAVQPDDRVSPFVAQEWENKLKAATDMYEEIKQGMDKLREANGTLRSQNVDLVHENMRLKAEVANRSPQKFGRYTVAALEARIQQYEREVDQLKRALERSDQYIEDLESQLRKSENRKPETWEARGNSKGAAEVLQKQQKLNMMMMRSLSDGERRSICSNPEGESRTFSRNHSLVFMPSSDHNRSLTGEQKEEDSEGTTSDFLPTTPSSAFRSLTLRSPGIREKKVAFKPVSHLRRLNFEEYASPGNSSAALEKKINSLEKFPKGLFQNEMESSKPVFWGSWQRSSLQDPSHPCSSKETLAEGNTSATLIREEPDSLQMSSEASMDAAYLDKISELDSMMHDGESSSSRGSQLSLTSSPRIDLDNTLVPEQQTCPDTLTNDGGKPGIHVENKNQSTDDGKHSDSTVGVAPTSSEKKAFAAPVSDGKDGAHVPSSEERAGPSQTEEMSFDLLFDPLDEVKSAPSGSLSPVNQHQDLMNSSFSSSCVSSKPVNTTRDRNALNCSQPTKRKSHSPFSTSSPTKLSKLM
ncbi:ORC ubiquitin ligase 1 [Cyprinodon tularosa]|uniref:ORC ubiquitin ligase 1 n=1 Tax=Cyprinodon tularosa TaxID=77115 RepID=UPI0018E26DE6|nr:ORC ubiquitin ligase 1 [Cyprinodon tularosa]